MNEVKVWAEADWARHACRRTPGQTRKNAWLIELRAVPCRAVPLCLVSISSGRNTSMGRVMMMPCAKLKCLEEPSPYCLYC